VVAWEGCVAMEPAKDQHELSLVALEGDGGNSPTPGSPPEQLLAADALRTAGECTAAIHAYTDYISAHGRVAAVLCSRAECFVRHAQRLTAMTPAEWDSSTQSGQDPQKLAELGLRDAEEAAAGGEAAVAGVVTRALLWTGRCHMLLEEYEPARAAYAAGAAAASAEGDEALASALREGGVRAQEEISKATVPAVPAAGAAGAAGAGAGAAASGGEASAPASSSAAAGGSAGDGDGEQGDFDCPVCRQLLLQPVTSPCGHTFCRHCLDEMMGQNNRCPTCRTVLHITPGNHPVSITIQKIIETLMPQQLAARTAERQREVKEEQAAGSGGEVANLPLFMLEHVLPGQIITLNIFEPRYRLMVRRCLDGERRFGMSTMERNHLNQDPTSILGCEVEIVDSRQLHDGRYHIKVEAKRRFRVRSLSDQDGYRCANVEFFTDDKLITGLGEAAGEGGSPSKQEMMAVFVQLTARKTRMTGLVKEWLSRSHVLGQRSPKFYMMVKRLLARAGKAPGTFESYSFWAANIVPHSTAEAQTMLGIVCTKQRMHMVCELLQAVLEQTSLAQERLEADPLSAAALPGTEGCGGVSGSAVSMGEMGGKYGTEGCGGVSGAADEADDAVDGKKDGAAMAVAKVETDGEVGAGAAASTRQGIAAIKQELAGSNAAAAVQAKQPRQAGKSSRRVSRQAAAATEQAPVLATISSSFKASRLDSGDPSESHRRDSCDDQLQRAAGPIAAQQAEAAGQVNKRQTPE